MILGEMRCEENVPFERVRSDLSHMVEGMGARAKSVAVRAAAVRGEGPPGVVICRLDIEKEAPKGREPEVLTYPRMILLREIWPIESLSGQLESIATGTFRIADIAVQLASTAVPWSRYDLPSRSALAARAGTLFRQRSCSDKGGGAFGEPLLAHGCPFHPEALRGIGEWTGLRHITFHQQTFIGEILMFVPWSAAHFGDVRREEECVVLPVAGPARIRDGLVVRGGVWSAQDTCNRFESAVKDGAARVEVGKEAVRFEAYLIDPNDNVLDCHREQRGVAGEHPPVVFRAAEGADLVAGVEAALLRGEGESLEFKPGIDLHHAKKVREVVRTAIAMANGDGGRIIIGVLDDCTVEGFERNAPVETLGRSRKRDYANYRARVLNLIATWSTPSFEVAARVVEVQEHKVLVLDVPAGGDRPYHEKDTNKVYVRRGANTVVANPRSDLPRLSDQRRPAGRGDA